MTSGQEDPNNHVPKVSPDDQWDDLDSEEGSGNSQLPPRRVDRKIPPKKELKRVSVTHHEAQPKVDNNPSGPLGKKGAKKARKTAKKAAKKKPARSSVSKNGKEQVRPKEADSGAAESAEESTRTDQVSPATGLPQGQLPAAPEGKTNRARVREITPEKESAANIQGVSKMIPSVAIQDQKPSDEDVAKQRRRFVRGERDDWGKKRGRDSMRWMFYSGVGIVLLVVLAVFLAQRVSRRGDRESDKSFFSQLEAMEVEEEVVEEEVVDDFPVDSKEKANRIYAAFATAESISDFSDFVYLAEENMPIIEERWEPSDVSANWTPQEESVWSVMEAEGERYGVLNGVREDFTKFSAFFRNGESGLKLDWKATVGYCSTPFEELKTGKGEGSEIRVMISLSDFYTFALSEEIYQCYRLVSPDGEHTLWGYTQIGGELGTELRSLFVRSQITGEMKSDVQAVISMESGPDESLPNQWIITDLVRLSWLDQ